MIVFDREKRGKMGGVVSHFRTKWLNLLLIET